MKGIEVRLAAGRDEYAAWLYRPPEGDIQVPAVVPGIGLSYVRDQGIDRFAGCFAAASYAAFAFATGTSVTAVERATAARAAIPRQPFLLLRG